MVTRYTDTVQKGEMRGKALGFPTANIQLDDATVSGIYAARVYLKDEASYQAAAYIDQKRNILEVHLLDFSDDLYGQTITIDLLKRMRGSKKFESEKELKKAIAKDIKSVREYFNSV